MKNEINNYNTDSPNDFPLDNPIQKWLTENDSLIEAIKENQSLNKLEECLSYQSRLDKNLKFLSSIIENQPHFPDFKLPSSSSPTEEGGGRTTRSSNKLKDGYHQTQHQFHTHPHTHSHPHTHPHSLPHLAHLSQMNNGAAMMPNVNHNFNAVPPFAFPFCIPLLPLDAKTNYNNNGQSGQVNGNIPPSPPSSSSSSQSQFNYLAISPMNNGNNIYFAGFPVTDHPFLIPKNNFYPFPSDKGMGNDLKKARAEIRFWSPEEHERFLEALQKYGQKDLKSIANCVGTRSVTQIRSHMQKYFVKLKKQQNQQSESESERESERENERERGRERGPPSSRSRPRKKQKISDPSSPPPPPSDPSS